jgi:hypothetical protein
MAGKSPFSKRIVVPIWVLQILVLLAGIGIYALQLIAIIAYKDDITDALRENYGTSLTYSTVFAIVVIILAIFGLCLIIDLICIIKRARRTLSPRFFLISNIIQCVIWTVLFALSMVGARTGLSIGISIAT